MNIVSTEVDRVFTDDTIIELLAADAAVATPDSPTNVESADEGGEVIPGSDHVDALDDLTADLRLKLADKYERIVPSI